MMPCEFCGRELPEGYNHERACGFGSAVGLIWIIESRDCVIDEDMKERIKDFIGKYHKYTEKGNNVAQQ